MTNRSNIIVQQIRTFIHFGVGFFNLFQRLVNTARYFIDGGGHFFNRCRDHIGLVFLPGNTMGTLLRDRSSFLSGCCQLGRVAINFL